MPGEKNLKNGNQWLGLMQIVKVNFPLPKIVKQIENLFLDLDVEPVIAGGIISDSYLYNQGIIADIKSSDIDVFLDLQVSLTKIRRELKKTEEVTGLTEIEEERVSGYSTAYSQELVSRRMSFRYQGYNCDLLFCENNTTKIWDFDLTFRQFMYYRRELYATKLAIKDIKSKLLRVLNPVTNIETWQRITKFRKRYKFEIEGKSLKLLLDYIKWLGQEEKLVTEDRLIKKEGSESIFSEDLREYYYRLISQKKAQGRALLTYLLLNNNFYSDYLSDLLGTYQVKYDSNLNYTRFMNKIKDLQFKVETELEDKKEIIKHKFGGKEAISFGNSENCKRVLSLLNYLTRLKFKEFLSGRIAEEKVSNFHKWHSPKLGKTLMKLKKFINKLEFEYYQNYILNLCDQLLKLFNTRGPASREFEIIISQKAIDLLAISTDKNWTSCLELPEPSNQRVSAARVAANLQPNTLVAYITDLNGQEWLGRVLIRVLQNGDLKLEKYYGEPVLKDILFLKLEEIISNAGYQLNKDSQGCSCSFIEWEPYSDQGRVEELQTDIYRKYYINYALPPIIKEKFKKVKDMESEYYEKISIFRAGRDLYRGSS